MACRQQHELPVVIWAIFLSAAPGQLGRAITQHSGTIGATPGRRGRAHLQADCHSSRPPTAARIYIARPPAEIAHSSGARPVGSRPPLTPFPPLAHIYTLHSSPSLSLSFTLIRAPVPLAYQPRIEFVAVWVCIGPPLRLLLSTGHGSIHGLRVDPHAQRRDNSLIKFFGFIVAHVHAVSQREIGRSTDTLGYGNSNVNSCVCGIYVVGNALLCQNDTTPP